MPKTSILFLVRFPRPDDLKDGYFQRVLAMDDLLSQFDRWYVNYESGWTLPCIKEIKGGVFEIQASKYDPLGLLFVLFAVFRTRVIYLHSILRLNSIFHRAVFSLSKKRIIDIHGAVPEEIEYHGNEGSKERFNEIERTAVKNASLIIGVTRRIIRHLEEKHGLSLMEKALVIPIFNNDAGEAPSVRAVPNAVIYCGGLQKWQQVGKMLEFVHRHKNDCRFTFLVPDPDGLTGLYLKKYKEDFPGIAESVSHDRVREYYEANSYGLVLRDESVVNRVACPTKLIEYMQCNVVPIVDYPAIGDFSDYGYQSVSYLDDLPDNDKRLEMAAINRRILEKMLSDAGSEKDKLLKIIVI